MPLFQRRLKIRTFVRNAQAFTILELLTIIAIVSLLCAIAVPKLSGMKGQMKGSEEARTLMSNLAFIRAEAIRLRANVKVSFTSTSYSWDLYNDGTTDGTQTLGTNTKWSGGTPTQIIFNGLGLARGITGTKYLTFINSGWTSRVGLNSNGYIER